MKKSFITIGLISSLFLLSGCDTKGGIDESLVAQDKSKEAINKNFDSKQFSLKTVDGNRINLETTLTGIDFKEHKGKVILVDVFATWCPPCIEAIPHMNELTQKYEGEFEIISVLFEKDKTKEEIEAFVKEHDIKYPVTIGEENFKFTDDLGDVSKVPEYYLYDKNGDYIRKFVGETDKAVFERYIKQALSK
ncbi:MAG: TlpA family protein disulfide reductase [Campylobacterota bacterium]